MAIRREDVQTPDAAVPATAPAQPCDSLALPLWCLFILGVLPVLFYAREILIPVALAGLAALILSPMVRWLVKIKIPRVLASLVILCIALGSVAGLTNYLSHPVGEWVQRIPDEARTLERKLHRLKRPIQDVRETTEKLDELTRVEPESAKQDVVISKPGLDSILFNQTRSFLFGGMTFVVLLYFILAFGHSLPRIAASLLNSYRSSRKLLRSIDRVRCEVSHYLSIISLINLILGIATAGVLYLLDIPNPILWGTLTAVLNYFPYIGPMVNISLIALVSVLTFDNLEQMWLPPLTVFLLDLLEGQLIQPIFVGNFFRLNPVLVLLSILGWGWLWGVAGVAVAIPSLVIARILFEELRRI